MNPKKMMQQMQKMQKEMQKVQESLKEQIVEGTSGGGVVTIKANGQKEIVDVIIKEEAIDPDDVEMLQDLIVAATNEALKKAEELSNKTMGKLTNGLNIPGF